jgi:2-oxoglutarate ferredoxin oxidoreductase subunit gamma
MTEKIIIAGSGGQGVMLLGKVLAQAALRTGKNTTYFPSYGAEVRGGTAYCMVVISDEEIGSPYIQKADTLIILNQPSLEKFRHRLAKKGSLIVNSSLAPGGGHPFTDIATRLGNVKVANMVALGYFIRKKKIFPASAVEKVFLEIAPADKQHLVEINKKALAEGMRLE